MPDPQMPPVNKVPKAGAPAVTEAGAKDSNPLKMNVEELRVRLRENARALKDVAKVLRKGCRQSENERELYADMSAALRLGDEPTLLRLKDQIETLGPVAKVSFALRMMGIDIEAFNVKYNNPPLDPPKEKLRTTAPIPKKTTPPPAKKRWDQEGEEWREQPADKEPPRTWHAYFSRYGKADGGYTGVIEEIAKGLENPDPLELAELKKDLVGYQGKLPKCKDAQGLDILKKSEFIKEGGLLRIVRIAKDQNEIQRHGNANEALALINNRVVGETFGQLFPTDPLKAKHNGSAEAEVGEAILVGIAQPAFTQEFGSDYIIPRTNDIVRLITERQEIQNLILIKQQNAVLDSEPETKAVMGAANAISILGLSDVRRTDEGQRAANIRKPEQGGSDEQAR